MLDHYLIGAIEDIENLIKLTSEDIEHIIEAEHSLIFERTALKEELLISFQNKKSLIDNELYKIKEEHGELSAETVPSDILDLLDKLSDKFKELKKVNKKYAKFILTITEFYNSFLDKVLPQKDKSGYGRSEHKSSLLKIEA